MLIGFNEGTSLQCSNLERDLYYLEKYGYDFIEPRLDKLDEYLTTHSLNELKKLFNSSKIKPYALNSLENFNLNTEDEFRDIRNIFTGMCEICDLLGCRTVIIVPSVLSKSMTQDKIKQDSIKCISQFSDIAERYNVKVGYEFVGHPIYSVNNFSQCYDIVKAVDRENVGIVIDCCHFYGCNSKIEDLRKADSEKIFAFHIDDYKNLPEEKLTEEDRVWPGDGVIPLGDILGTLKEIGFNQVATLELFNPDYYKLGIDKIVGIGKEKTKKVLDEYLK